MARISVFLFLVFLVAHRTHASSSTGPDPIRRSSRSVEAAAGGTLGATGAAEAPIAPPPTTTVDQNNKAAASVSASSEHVNLHITPQQKRRLLLDTFAHDLTKIQGSLVTADIVLPTHSKRDSSYTKLWTNEDWDLHQLNCWSRYRKSLWTWFQSPTALAILPTVASVVSWAVLVMLLSSKFEAFASFISSASFSTTTGTFTAPIALLLTLRTNRALDRLLEARRQWGVILKAQTALAGMAATYIQEVKDTETAVLIGRYLAIFGWSLKGMLRQEDDAPVVNAILPALEAQWLLNDAPLDRPTAIIFRIRSLLSSMGDTVPMPVHSCMEERLCDLETALGTCKRLVASPIPPTYTRHTSRVLFLFLFLIPLALVGNAKNNPISPLAVILNVALTAYVSIGLDEIAIEIEHPTPLLPMYALCNMMQQAVANQFEYSQDVPLVALQPTP